MRVRVRVRVRLRLRVRVRLRLRVRVRALCLDAGLSDNSAAFGGESGLWLWSRLRSALELD